jgi:ABC-type multidrug transport system fused ATPase/permease subunit
MTAIVSRSGTGKSTLLNLLSKLYKPDSGCIYINNEPLNTKSDEFIQQNISYVTQDNYIFKGTFYSNVIYGNHGFDISEERVKECLRLAEAEQFVTNKGGIQGEVMEAGENLSGGEKQKLVLARALVKRPPILILD